MKPSAQDTEPATLEGTITSSGPSSALSSGHKTAPAVWKLRLVYAASSGSVKAPPVIWEGSEPLEIGRHSSIVVEDLHSRNGRARNGVRLQPGVPQPLADGDVLRVGDSFLVLRHEQASILDSPVPSFIGVSKAPAISQIEAHSGYSRSQFRRWVEGYGLDLATFRGGAPE